MPQPQPVDVDWGVDHTPNGSHVVLVANTFQGQSVFFLNHQFLQQFIDALIEQGATAEQLRNQQGTQLVVPAKVVLGPQGQPLLVQPPAPPEAPVEVKSEPLHSPPAAGEPFQLLQGGGDDAEG